MAELKATQQKISYTVSCQSSFRNAVIGLAEKKKCNVADLARSVLLVVSQTTIDGHPDPGEPARDDRETVVLKSGKSKGKPWRRKPRLQVRLSPGFASETIRRALSLALALAQGHVTLDVLTTDQRARSEMELEAQSALLRDTHDELERLRNVATALTFEPLPSGVHNREQALYVLGFTPGSIPEQNAIRMRFRRLATVYHPDGKLGSHERMSQLNAAMELLGRGGL